MPELSDANAIAISQRHPAEPRTPFLYQKAILQVYGSGSTENRTSLVNYQHFYVAWKNNLQHTDLKTLHWTGSYVMFLKKVPAIFKPYLYLNRALQNYSQESTLKPVFAGCICTSGSKLEQTQYQ